CPPIFGGHLMHQGMQQQKVQGNSRLLQTSHSRATLTLERARAPVCEVQNWIRLNIAASEG
ncbi:hypothetical protein, partial [Mesorhizobium sp.]|uniref:hypothetical protein n=1 Tax=Mesorhizobium sp. TaxID=1871066 RepID=UPI0025C256B8